MKLRTVPHVKVLSAAVLLAACALPLKADAFGPASPEVLAEIRQLAGAALPYLAVHKEPQPLPEHVLLDGDEQATSLNDYRGKILLVNFWATWCPPCRFEMPDLDRLHAMLGGPEFSVIAVNIDRDGLKRANNFYAEKEIRSLDIHLDPRAETTGKMRVVNLPTSLLIDRSGHEIGRISGTAEWDSEPAIQFFREVIALTRNEATAAATELSEACEEEPCPGS